MNVYILLDRSGSMSNLWEEAIGSINGYVKSLKAADNVDFSVFDSVSNDTVRETKVKKWLDVDSKEISPRGSTPLYDAVGSIMTKAEEANAKKTVLVVMTDGYENASKEHTKETIKAKVKQFENRGWQIVFLGANFDSVETVSGKIGVGASNSMNIFAGNMEHSMSTLSIYTRSYGAGASADISFTAKDKQEAVGTLKPLNRNKKKESN